MEQDLGKEKGDAIQAVCTGDSQIKLKPTQQAPQKPDTPLVSKPQAESVQSMPLPPGSFFHPVSPKTIDKNPPTRCHASFQFSGGSSTAKAQTVSRMTHQASSSLLDFSKKFASSTRPSIPPVRKF